MKEKQPNIKDPQDFINTIFPTDIEKEEMSNEFDEENSIEETSDEEVEPEEESTTSLQAMVTDEDWPIPEPTDEKSKRQLMDQDTMYLCNDL